MSEPCTIYITRNYPVTNEEILKFAREAGGKISEVEKDWTEIEISFGDGTLTLHNNQGVDEKLREHLSGFQGYIWKCAGQQMTAPVYHLIQRIYLVSGNIGTTATPEITPPMETFITSLAGSIHGLLFRGSSVCAPDFTILIGDNGYNGGAMMSYWPDSLERRQKNTDMLAEAGIKIPLTLPLASEHEVQLRGPGEVANRAITVYLVAYYAVPNGISLDQANEALANHEGSLTPQETAFLASAEPDDQEKINFAWRFEALWLLLWAMKLVDELDPPEIPAAVDTIDSVINGAGGLQKIRAINEMRSAAEILDQADYHMRAHWAVRQARQENKPAPDGLDGSVLQERRHALNWLISFENSEWDDVDTPT